MVHLSVTISEPIYTEMNQHIAKLQISEQQYITNAIRDYNQRLSITSSANQMEKDSIETQDRLSKELSELDDFVGDQL